MADNLDDYLEAVAAEKDARDGCRELLEDSESAVVIAQDESGFNYGAHGLDWELYGFLRYVVDELGTILGAGSLVEGGDDGES